MAVAILLFLAGSVTTLLVAVLFGCAVAYGLGRGWDGPPSKAIEEMFRTSYQAGRRASERARTDKMKPKATTGERGD